MKTEMILAMTASAALTACTHTVKVTQDKPIEIHVRVDIYEHAKQLVDELDTPLPDNSKPRSALSPPSAAEWVGTPNIGGAERSLDEIKTSIRARVNDIHALKKAGAVGEDSRGYLGIVDASKGSKVKELVEAENADRRALYQILAREHGVSVAEEERANARARHERAPKGDWIEVGGKWVQK